MWAHWSHSSKTCVPNVAVRAPPYQFEENYATARADRKIEATEVKKFVDNEVFEPLDRPKGLAHLLRYAPLFLILKKQTGELLTRLKTEETAGR